MFTLTVVLVFAVAVECFVVDVVVRRQGRERRTTREKSDYLCGQLVVCVSVMTTAHPARCIVASSLEDTLAFTFGFTSHDDTPGILEIH